jgi:hypothetical protein
VPFGIPQRKLEEIRKARKDNENILTPDQVKQRVNETTDKVKQWVDKTADQVKQRFNETSDKVNELVKEPSPDGDSGKYGIRPEKLKELEYTGKESDKIVPLRLPTLDEVKQWANDLFKEPSPEGPSGRLGVSAETLRKQNYYLQPNLYAYGPLPKTEGEKRAEDIGPLFVPFFDQLTGKTKWLSQETALEIVSMVGMKVFMKIVGTMVARFFPKLSKIQQEAIVQSIEKGIEMGSNWPVPKDAAKSEKEVKGPEEGPTAKKPEENAVKSPSTESKPVGEGSAPSVKELAKAIDAKELESAGVEAFLVDATKKEMFGPVLKMHPDFMEYLDTKGPGEISTPRTRLNLDKVMDGLKSAIKENIGKTKEAMTNPMEEEKKEEKGQAPSDVSPRNSNGKSSNAPSNEKPAAANEGQENIEQAPRDRSTPEPPVDLVNKVEELEASDQSG